MNGRPWSGWLDDAAEMVNLRRQLVESELKQDRQSMVRFVVIATPALVLAVCGLSLLLWLLLWNAAQSTSWSVTATFLVAAIALIIAGSVVTVLAWRKLNRELCLLRDSMAELREDIEWLRSSASSAISE